MKKIVVVVDSKSGESYKELFLGEKLKVQLIDEIQSTGSLRLEIINGDNLLAQFFEWTYWRKID